jgi:5-methylcytosine-specific restriction endonuclease McrA
MTANTRLILLALLLAAATAGAGGRSRTLRAEFMRLHPCPSTGLTRGACPGWQVDHIEALVCGGRDELANLQWLEVEPHRQKTRVEVKLCRSR